MEPKQRKRERRTRRSPRGDQSRTAILDVAERHFSEHGFRKASIASIAEEVGMSDPGLLHHFGSKAGLLTALLDERFSVDKVKLHEDESLSLDDLVSLLIDIVIENTSRRTGVKLLTVIHAESLTEGHPARTYFQERYDHVRKILADHIENAKAKGEVKADVDAQHIAMGLIAIMDGLQVQWLLDDTKDMAAAHRTMLTYLAAGLQPPDAVRSD